MEYYKRKKNTPIAKLIQDYQDKKSRRVMKSRKEIQERFEHLDWKDQKTILKAHLGSCATDRSWAYRFLSDYWDKSFEPIVENLWHQFHEQPCARIIIQNFPVDFIQENMRELTEKRNFYHFCLRMAKENICIYVDRERFVFQLDYLNALLMMNQPITQEEATDTLLQLIYDECMEKTLNRYIHIDPPHYKESPIRGALSFPTVDEAIIVLRKMGHSGAIKQFETWNRSVCEDISQYFEDHPEQTILWKYHIIHKIARKFCYQALPSKYKSPTDPSFDIEEHVYDDSFGRDGFEIVPSEFSSLELESPF